MWYHRNGQRYAGLDHRRSISSGKGLDFALSAMGNLWRVLIRKMALSDFFFKKILCRICWRGQKMEAENPIR